MLFLSFCIPFLFNLLLRARTRSQVFRAFLWAAAGQLITFGAAATLLFTPTHVPSVRDAVNSSRESAQLVKKDRASISRKFVLWTVVAMLFTIPSFAALFLTPTENDRVYIPANALFQVSQCFRSLDRVVAKTEPERG